MYWMWNFPNFISGKLTFDTKETWHTLLHKGNYIYLVSLFILALFSSVQLLSRVRLFATPWIAACQASLSITNSRNLLKLMSIESVLPSSHLILCRPLLLLPPIPRSIRVFSNESTLRMRWPKYWSFSFSSIQSLSYVQLFVTPWIAACQAFLWRRKWQPTPVFLPGESQGWGAWWAAIYGVAQSQTRLKRLSSMFRERTFKKINESNEVITVGP